MNSTPENCPCGAVEELKKNVEHLSCIAEDHEKRLAAGSTDFALIKLDLEYIKTKLDAKSKFGSGVAISIITTACALLLGYIAAKLGIA